MALKPKRTIPNDIRFYRRRRNLRIVEVASLAKVADAALVSHWENGRKMPTLKNALKLSAITKCPVEILYHELFRSYQNEYQPQNQQGSHTAI